MKLAPIISHFWEFLPRYTNFFTDTVSISALTADIGTATAISVGHGLTTGQRVNITGAIQVVNVDTSSYDDLSGIFTIETTDNHGLTKTFDYRTSEGELAQPVTVQIQGFIEPQFNGTFNLLTVPNRKKFTCQVEKNLGIVPTGSGQVLNYAFNTFIGLQIITVLDIDTFTYPVSDDSMLETAGTILAHHQFRIQASINVERIFASYTKQPSNKYVLFLTYGDEVISKERLILNDANTTLRSGTRRRQHLLDGFNVIAIAPTSDEIAAIATRDSFDDVEIALLRTALFLPADDRFSAAENFFFSFSSATDIEYNGAYLARQWNFQSQYDITLQDGFNEYKRVPFLNITGSINDILELSIDLDEDA